MWSKHATRKGKLKRKTMCLSRIELPVGTIPFLGGLGWNILVRFPSLFQGVSEDEFSVSVPSDDAPLWLWLEDVREEQSIWIFTSGIWCGLFLVRSLLLWWLLWESMTIVQWSIRTQCVKTWVRWMSWWRKTLLDAMMKFYLLMSLTLKRGT